MFLIIIIVAIIALDQWSKWAIKTSFNLYQSKPVIQDLLHFTYVTNDGMAFGLSFPGGKHVLLIMTILLTGFIVGFLWKAIGNLIDRLLYGKVVDFLDLMIGNFHWYIFNIADSSVTIGMILFIIHSIYIEQKKTNDELTV